MTDAPLRTDWTDRLANGTAPEPDALRGHLRRIHRDHAGFTESCAMRCRDAAGRTSYAWLAEAVEPARHRVLLDLACGSGPLLQLCHASLPADIRLIGVDMSPDELALARDRLPEGRARLIEAQAQQLDELDDGAVDVALCHWALTLMDPVAPVLEEVGRVLAPGGRFAALVDGPAEAAPGYADVHDLIYGHVQAELPAYGTVDLGDPRVRSSDDLVALARAALPGASVRIETSVVTMSGPAETLAQEAAGFFYAAFVLSPAARLRMLADLAGLLSDMAPDGQPTFAMPVNRLVADLA
ncbi:class I SAM-dependent methyltransferase [Rhodosalinus sp.]|uniref:class I SAM-dependent methyltransferase n=1 Tax=Rhodosalinus sp. TaxID=2047741 RepID=UPI0035665F43